MSEVIVSVHELWHTYLVGTPLATPALCGASLELRRGEALALVGPSGAGKSTLLHYVNGLLQPAERGHVIIFGADTADPGCDLASLRRRVGLVFQSPQQQLFERYLGDDVAYGPRQLGLTGGALRERVRWALEAVGLPFDDFVDRHTFSLSGGEMRRAALAGVLAMHPEVLILDEATTGLDPRGRRQVHALVQRLRAEHGISVLLVSNDMDQVAELAERVVVLYAGRTVMEGGVREILVQAERLEGYGLASPSATASVRATADALEPRHRRVRRDVLRVDEAVEALWQAMTA